MTLPEHIISRKLLDGRGMLASNNQVFQFSYHRKDYFAKIYREPSCFEREIFALENFGHAGIPVPEIAFKSALYGGSQSSLVVTEGMKGTTLDKIERQRQRYCYQAGELLAQIHAIKIPAIVQPLVIPIAEVAEGIASFTRDENINHPLLQCMDKTLAELNLSNNLVLSHGDYIGRHIFVFRRAVSGIVDWEYIRAARPELDVGYCCAALEIFGSAEDERSFIQGYGLNFDDSINHRVKLYYKIILAKYWKRRGRTQDYQKAMCSIAAHPG